MILFVADPHIFVSHSFPGTSGSAVNCIGSRCLFSFYHYVFLRFFEMPLARSVGERRNVSNSSKRLLFVYAVAKTFVNILALGT